MDEGVLEGMVAFGAPADEVAAVRAAMEASQASRRVPESFPVYRDNWRSVTAFLAVSTQWARAGMNGQRTGLMYEGVLGWVDRFIPRRCRREVFGDLQLMERAVLSADRELQSDDDM